MQWLLEKFFYLVLYILARPVFAWTTSTRLHRWWSAQLTLLMMAPRGQDVQRQAIGGISCEIRRPAPGAGNDLRILYVHGGWYCIGGAATHRAITGALARDADATVILPDYRLAPEHAGPAALEDMLAVYAELIRQPGPVVLAGDSAGGGLGLSLAVAIRDAGLAAPAAVYLISPLVDLTYSGASHAERRWRDCVLSSRMLDRGAALYLAGQAADDPRYSPLFANLQNLPPVLIQVGSEEILHADSVQLAGRLREAGGTVELEEFPGLWHVFHLQAMILKRAAQALSNAAGFLQHHAQARRA